ncbi:glutathione S-transferase family protein [Phaeobacter marinintestinus]|uniref:glutathione S-transferase family protein n=1 Tax=Falsiphaeobacter marinintestinus TaxID=1492905 RepID=UPI001644567C|nr:glutathione S-transferase [Phaeobacter marinintestinus]
MTVIKVHHLNQSRSLRILWLLEELNLPYEVIRYERDATTRLAPPELAQIHPLGKSPVIEIDGQIVAESGAIVETIVARHGQDLVPPKDSDAYIQHLELMHFAEGSVMTPLLLNLYTARLGEAAAPLQPRIQQEMANHYGYLETVIRPSGHFVLDDLSAADIMLSFPVSVLSRLGLEDSYPNLAAFNQMVRSRPAFQKALEQAGGD